MAFTQREVKTEKMVLSMEIELISSTLTPDEAVERIQNLINSYRADDFSKFIVFLLRESKSSMWEMKKLEIN